MKPFKPLGASVIALALATPLLLEGCGAETSSKDEGTGGASGSGSAPATGAASGSGSAQATGGTPATGGASASGGTSGGDGAAGTGGCASGEVDCGGGCTNIKSDPAHCGACGKVCPLLLNVTAQCVDSKCTSACKAPYLDCDGDGSCELDGSSDQSNCGWCGAACKISNGTAVCQAGLCSFVACNPGWANCDGTQQWCETSVDTNVAACGGCGSPCSGVQVASSKCEAGLCKPTCHAPYGDCNGPQPGNIDDGCEVNLSTDATHCGTCGKACGTGEKCCGGTCVSGTVCPAGDAGADAGTG